MGEWQLIETAPRDEEVSILACQYEGEWYSCDVVHWVSWEDESGWFNGDIKVDADYFTHWMPLPDPPQ